MVIFKNCVFGCATNALGGEAINSKKCLQSSYRHPIVIEINQNKAHPATVKCQIYCRKITLCQTELWWKKNADYVILFQSIFSEKKLINFSPDS